MRETMREICGGVKLKDYILDLVVATREPGKYRNLKEFENMIECGASPRATIALARAAKAHAFVEHRGYVLPDDIKAIGKDVLRHRIILTYEAEAEQITQDYIINRIFDEIEIA
ncbi:MAG: ATPase, partial [Candidatus Zophobacter franzmannii]|nr:ATPase [Candidatus Zophobacter franzmannii]